MTRAEFLEQLRSALQGNVQEHVVQENVAYYNQYISEELQKGKTAEGKHFFLSLSLLQFFRYIL